MENLSGILDKRSYVDGFHRQTFECGWHIRQLDNIIMTKIRHLVHRHRRRVHLTGIKEPFMAVTVSPLVAPWGRFGLYTVLIYDT